MVVEDHAIKSHQVESPEVVQHRLDIVAELRSRVSDLLTPKYDTDFNLLRWIINAEKFTAPENVMDTAEKQLRNHLRYRQAMQLDEIKIPSIEENPLFKERLMPRGSFNLMKSTNRFLWWTDYKTTDMVGIVKSRKSSEMLWFHFLLYEEMLRKVNEVEKCTGNMSGMDAITDLAHYDMNPFALLILNNGQLNYYITTFHYDHYPQLVAPIWVINIPKWIYFPYRIMKSFLPKDSSDRIRLLDSNFKATLRSGYCEEELPEYLGGTLKDDELRTVPAKAFTPDEFYTYSIDENVHTDYSHVFVKARCRKFIHLNCQQDEMDLKFRFLSDGDFIYGFFYDGDDDEKKAKTGKLTDLDLDSMKMVKAPIRIGARFVPEEGTIRLQNAGSYYLVLCNRQTWLMRRNIYYKMEMNHKTNGPSPVLHRTFSE